MRTLILAAVAGFLLIFPLRAEEAFYLGTWKLDSAVVAPWANPHNKPDATEMNTLVGKTVSVTPAAITGPKVFACKGPHYKLGDFTADLLFQGAFGEMHDNDKNVDPQKLATSLGFSGPSFKTLETGCEFDWHFVNPTTAEIGLNDYVYTLKKTMIVAAANEPQHVNDSTQRTFLVPRCRAALPATTKLWIVNQKILTR